ncbi:MAG TPA: hypothetical protein VK553_10360 [Candidatus Nitrosopolaris rasttigaisensis]|nr:hypothetical protein [Candidatus Nitrosopolaris rasttigaisensis]
MFVEWSENKIGRIASNNINHPLPFSVSASSQELTLKKGQSMEIKVNISTVRVSSPPSPLNVNIDMLASGTFTPTGDLGNSTGSSSEQSFSLEPMHTKEVSFIFTPTTDLWAGEYTSMLGEQNGAITVMKAVKVHIVV